MCTLLNGSHLLSLWFQIQLAIFLWFQVGLRVHTFQDVSCFFVLDFPRNATSSIDVGRVMRVVSPSFIHLFFLKTYI